MKKMKTPEKGASGGEYGLIVGLVSVLAIGAVFGVGIEVKRAFETTTDALSTQTPEKPILSVTDVKDVHFGQIDENTSLLIFKEDLLDPRYTAEGIFVSGLTANQGGQITQNEDHWIFTPTPHFSATATLTMTVQKTQEDKLETSTARVFIPVSAVADAPTLNARLEPAQGVDPITTADFSADGPTPASEGVRFDMTIDTWQSPAPGAKNGIYDVTQAIASDHKDTFVFTSPSGTYELLETQETDVISFPNHTADKVTIDGLTRTLRVDGATINYGNIKNFKFSGKIFDGTPHGLEFSYDLKGMAEKPVDVNQTPWTITGKTFLSKPTPNPYPSSPKHAPQGYEGDYIPSQERPIFGVFLDYAGTRDTVYELDIAARSGLENTEPENYEASNNSYNAFILFDAKDIQNFKAVVQRNGSERWAIEDYVDSTRIEAGSFTEENGIDDGIFYNIFMQADSTTARLSVEENGTKVEKATYDFGTTLNSNRIGVAVQQSNSEIIVGLKPTNWAPYAPDISLEGARGDEKLDTQDVLSMSIDPENDTLSILSFDATSRKGGQVTRAGNAFSYTPPSPNFVGSDSFSYAIEDGPNTTQAEVYVTVTSENAVDVAPGGAVKVDLDAQSDDPDETTRLTLNSLPVGAIITDGTNVFEATSGARTLDLDGWDLNSLVIDNSNITTGYAFNVTAYTTEDGKQSSIVQRTLSVQFL